MYASAIWEVTPGTIHIYVQELPPTMRIHPAAMIGSGEYDVEAERRKW